MNTRGLSLSEKTDIPVLLFLWKWKLLTTATITERFYSRYDSKVAGYSRLSKLEDTGLVYFRTDELCKKAYCRHAFLSNPFPL